jgi:uncharacterized protein (AIM24 family)
MSMAPSLSGGRARPVEVFRGPYACAGCLFTIRDAHAPVAEVRCHHDQPLLFRPSSLLWREPPVTLRLQHAAGRAGALQFGEAVGGGRLAFGPAVAACIVMLYLPRGQVIDLRRDNLLCAAGVRWSPPADNDPAALDRFTAGDEGVVLLAGAGCIYELVLEQGECVRIAAAALLYKDPSVTIAGGAIDGFPGALPCRGPGVLAMQLATWTAV